MLYIVIIIIIVLAVILFLKSSGLSNKESTRGVSTGSVVTGAFANPPSEGSCVGFCDSTPDGVCYCDAICESFGDCCGDYENVCKKPVDCCATVDKSETQCGTVVICYPEDGGDAQVCPATGTGKCPSLEQCVNGACVPKSILPDPCKNKDCSQVACGEACEVTDGGIFLLCGGGTKCANGASCVNGQCQICAPS